jgi:DNA-directed RNA polymerase I and III subunit RPAC1
VVFHLNLTCERNPKAPKGSTNPDELYINHELRSSHIAWEPQGEQLEAFASQHPAPTNPNIVLAKLRPGQEVSMELHAVKGVAKDHAKFSPVGTFLGSSDYFLFDSHCFFSATASYRLLPHIKITKPIPSHLAEKFQKCFSPGVIKIDPRTKAVSVDEQGVRNDSVSREVLRHPEFADSVQLSRVRDYFLCSLLLSPVSSRLYADLFLIVNVESEGPYEPERLLPEAIKVMREKLAIIKQAAEALRNKSTSLDSDVVMADA